MIVNINSCGSHEISWAVIERHCRSSNTW